MFVCVLCVNREVFRASTQVQETRSNKSFSPFLQNKISSQITYMILMLIKVAQICNEVLSQNQIHMLRISKAIIKSIFIIIVKCVYSKKSKKLASIRTDKSIMHVETY